MTSRLTTIALSFAVLTTASFAFAGTGRTQAATSVKPAPHVVQLERVVIIGKRLPAGV